MTTFDINARVNDHLKNAASRAASPSGYVVTLPLDGHEAWTGAVLAYWQQWGNAIGTEVAAVPPPAAAGTVKTRAVRVQPAVVSSITPRDLNIVVDRLPLRDDERFDLIVATNVLVYYDVFEQALAAANVAAMLRPGGVFVTNTAVLPTAPLRAIGRLPARRPYPGAIRRDLLVSARIANDARRHWPRCAVRRETAAGVARVHHDCLYRRWHFSGLARPPRAAVRALRARHVTLRFPTPIPKRHPNPKSIRRRFTPLNAHLVHLARRTMTLRNSCCCARHRSSMFAVVATPPTRMAACGDTPGNCAPYSDPRPAAAQRPSSRRQTASDGRGNVSRAAEHLARGARRPHRRTSTTLEILEQQGWPAHGRRPPPDCPDPCPAERLHAEKLLRALARDRELQLEARRRQRSYRGRRRLRAA